MMRTLRLTLACAGLIAGFAPAASAGPYAPRVGTRHPDFTLPRIDDRTPISLSDLRGKKVLLIQFASW
jgi:hypothetical protein